MGYSTNFYLDNAISQKELRNAKETGNKDLLRKMEDTIANRELQIFFYFRFSGKTIKVFTERKCRQLEWDFEKQRINPRYFKEGAVLLNNYLHNIERGAARIYEAKLENKQIILKEDLKRVIDTLNNRQAESERTTISFQSITEEFLKDREFKVTQQTISNFKTTFKHLKEFSIKYNYELIFENINMKFDSLFKDYLYTELNATNNTVSKHIKNIKVFMNFCTEERNYNSKLNVYYKKFVRKHNEAEVYALTLNELMKIYKHEFSSEKLSNVRDVFCFICFTGLRFSDVENLQRENIKEGHIELVIQKTKSRNSIPLNSYAKEILERYKHLDKPLPVISNQKTNEYLYEIGQEVELNELVAKSTYRGAEVVTNYLPKYEILTTHVGRKTFITNSLILGMHERVVREFSGHKKDSTFKRYVAFADKQKQEMMNDIWSQNKINAQLLPNTN
ncbi:MAG: tyrosine-type recombinase/integrase [Chitinophagales bacterium]